MVNGRGRFGIPARGWRRTSRTADPQDNGQGDIVEFKFNVSKK
ncbi:hypothetical protein [uncultured Bifidobacterium sp.]|nr:hypothetical protein [uncultured Bifidobacterium sp.]